MDQGFSTALRKVLPIYMLLTVYGAKYADRP